MQRRAATIPVNVEIDTDLNRPLEQWAREEGRSKRNLLAVLTRKLVTLRKTHPDDLKRLGLIDTAASVAR